MYNDIMAHSANIQAVMGVALVLILFFLISGPFGLRTQHSLMCIIEIYHMEKLISQHRRLHDPS
jgi:hypothetical protein